MKDNFEVVYNEETDCWEEKEEPYATIEIPTEKDFDLLMKKIDFSDKNHYEIEEAKETAVKEFAEKLKETVFDYLGVKTIEEADKLSLLDSTLTYDVVTDRIDELLKEYEK